MRYYSQEQIEKLNIYELRYLARESGVSSPTTKRRDELIALIMGIQDGTIAPSKKHLQGRPAKPFDLANDTFANKGVNISSEANASFFSNIVFKSAYTRYNAQKEKVIEVAGYLAQTKAGYSFINFNNPMCVELVAVASTIIIEKYNLKIGDYCFMNAKFVMGGDVPIVEEVISVNGQEPKYEERNNFDALTPSFEKQVIPFEKFAVADSLASKLQKQDLHYGDKALIISSETQKTNDVIKCVASAYSNHSEIVVVLIGTTPEQANYYINNVKATLFFSLFTDSYEKQKFITDLAVDYCKNQVANGKHIIMVVNSIMALECAGNRKNGDFSDDFDPIYNKEVLSFARNTKNHASLTIIGIVAKDDIKLINALRNNLDKELEDNL